MIGIQTKIVERPPSAEKIFKQIRYGTAVGLTKAAKDGQSAVLGAFRGTFTLRGNWFQQSSKFGIRIKSATPNDLASEVRTQADWLELHEVGGVKRAKGGRLAIPTENVRRNKRMIIPRAQRPAALRGKRTFVIKTPKGDVLFQRKFRGKRSNIVALFALEPQARIRKQSTFYEPITKVMRRRLNQHIEREIQKALAVIR